MSSWGYLIKRIIHTIITLIVVLILLFVIFRLMPGDPTRLFIPHKAGMDPDAYHLIAQRYGFEKQIEEPGNIYLMSVDTTLFGAYGMQLNVTDADGNKATYYGVYNKPGTFNIDVNTSVVDISLQSTPSLNDNIDVELELLCSVSCPSQFVVNITHDGQVFEIIDMHQTSSITSGTEELAEYSGSTSGTISEFGNYFMSFEATDVNDFEIFNIIGFSVNPSPAEFAPISISNLQIVETQLARPEASVQVTSSSSIQEIRLHLNTPNNIRSESPMTRSLIFVPVPYWEQFVIYMKNMLSFDFGESFVSGRAVWDELAQRIPPTLLLFGSALILSAIIGILLGAIMAWRRGSKFEISGIVVGLFFYSMPIFWFGLILLVVFSFHLGWFPLRGMLTPGAGYEGFDYVKDVLWHLTLPLITLTIGSLAGWLLLMRNSMLEVMGEDYITTAKAKGLPERKILYKHAARNAMLPIVTAIAMSLSGIISGGVLVETIFSWPGMGHYLVQSTLAYDFPAIQGAFFLLAILTIIANMLADLLYSYLDPRVRLTR
jgi:peptide/nickel transport system permease protein